MLDMVATREPGVASNSGSSRAVSAKWPRWFTPNCISAPSPVRASSIAMSPALLTSRSSRPERPAANAATLSRSARSSAPTSTVAAGVR